MGKRIVVVGVSAVGGYTGAHMARTKPIEAKLRKIAPSPIVSMTAANCGYPITRRRITASSAAPNNPMITSSAKASP